ncbi:hypothetical protein ILUMI_08463 [Ignelater luminosus]|uniref:Peptidase S1 domain-containing protein n=1 Tax=Ignelater luminosus TaxID=2038154 RepID=A0A8K0D6U3_IGNLU|nr:hypothetical protein ILUMI_08463 [Ignelater luminosus]
MKLIFVQIILAFASSVTAFYEIKETDDNRIVNGEDAALGQFPFIVSLSLVVSRQAGHFCGASIITRYWSLTAAHCIDAVNEILIEYNYIKVLGNTHILHYNPIHHEIECYKIYSEYDDLAFTNDIALIRVKQPFDGDYEKVITLPPRNFKYVNDSKVTIMGWGVLWPGGPEPIVLQHVEVRLIDDGICQKIYDPYPKLKSSIRPDIMVCAGEETHTKDSCQGDSGGPLIQELKQGGVRRQYQIGIVSWGRGCASKFPGVYVRVTKYLNWIENIMKKHDSGCQSKCIGERRYT